MSANICHRQLRARNSTVLPTARVSSVYVVSTYVCPFVSVRACMYMFACACSGVNNYCRESCDCHSFILLDVCVRVVRVVVVARFRRAPVIYLINYTRVLQTHTHTRKYSRRRCRRRGRAVVMVTGPWADSCFRDPYVTTERLFSKRLLCVCVCVPEISLWSFFQNLPFHRLPTRTTDNLVLFSHPLTPPPSISSKRATRDLNVFFSFF